jgi:hypothetical protein
MSRDGEHDEASVLQARYIHGAKTDELLARIAADGNVYYHHDALGNTTALLNSAGDKQR